MKREWGFLEKILHRQKIIESRWYSNKYKPWDAIARGDEVYFKNSGEQVLVKAGVKKVVQVSALSPKKVKEILNTYGKDIGIEEKNAQIFYNMLAHKKYCILIFLENSQKVKPFLVNKKGFGAMASWITVNDINSIKL